MDVRSGIQPKPALERFTRPNRYGFWWAYMLARLLGWLYRPWRYAWPRIRRGWLDGWSDGSYRRVSED